MCSSNEPAAKGERTGKAEMTPMLMGSMSSKRLSGTRPEIENFYVKNQKFREIIYTFVCFVLILNVNKNCAIISFNRYSIGILL